MLIELFDTHYHAYRVTSTQEFVMCDISELYDYHPLAVYRVNAKLLVPWYHVVEKE